MTTIKIDIKPKETARKCAQTWLTVTEHAELCKYTEENNITVAYLLRSLLNSLLPDKISR